MKLKEYLQTLLFFLIMFYIAFSIGACSPKATKYSVNACPKWDLAKR